MEYQIINERLVALILHNSEQLDLQNAKCIVKDALDGAGLDPWEKIEIDMFSGSGDTLLIAKPAGACKALIADYALPFFNSYFTD